MYSGGARSEKASPRMCIYSFRMIYQTWGTRSRRNNFSWSERNLLKGERRRRQEKSDEEILFLFRVLLSCLNAFGLVVVVLTLLIHRQPSRMKRKIAFHFHIHSMWLKWLLMLFASRHFDFPSYTKCALIEDASEKFLSRRRHHTPRQTLVISCSLYLSYVAFGMSNQSRKRCAMTRRRFNEIKCASRSTNSNAVERLCHPLSLQPFRKDSLRTVCRKVFSAGIVIKSLSTHYGKVLLYLDAA